jgi:hypothetical protein
MHVCAHLCINTLSCTYHVLLWDELEIMKTTQHMQGALVVLDWK